MNLLKTLESGQSKSQTTAITRYIGEDKKKFRELMDLFLKGENVVVQRAAWPLSEVAIKNPNLIKPYIDKLIKKLAEPGQHPAVPRNILRIFQFMDMPEKYQGQLVDLCFRFIMSETQPVAVRAFAITTATRICKYYPELQNELLIILNELSALPQTAAINVRIKFALKELQKSNSKV